MEHLTYSLIEYFRTKLVFLLPEVVLFVGSNILLLASLFEKKYHHRIWYGNLLVCLYVLVLGLAIFYTYQLPELSSQINFRRLILFSALLMAICFPKPRSIVQNRFLGEYYFLLSVSVLGFMVMLTAEEWLTLVISLELSAVALYVLVILAWRKSSLEGTLKYLLFGVMASAIMIYGISWLYGLQGGNLNFENITWKIDNKNLAYAAFILAISGFLLKISAFPWHIWTPDAYQTAPTAVVAFLATIPKIASIVIIYKLFSFYQPLLPALSELIVFIALVSIVLGNLVAFWQKNLKRMLAYSSVANAGFLLVATSMQKSSDEKILIFFLLVYVLANFLLFLLAEYYEQNYQITEIEQFAGIGQRHIGLMLAMLWGFLTLAGLPPTAGFTAKLLLFSLLWEKYKTLQLDIYVWWLVIGLLGTFLALFYYLKVPFQAFFKQAKNYQQTKKNLHLYITITFLAILILLLFFYPFLLFK
ncbi:MAG: NADH-quinone oxidoreductase subunit N [Raineya sp.]|nr:NADH-quinone oxidoreductase subunit N [Raineya sp.]MDW8296478.1 NADH-quinone oxidoreductase subunit N [Raineya sp.]